MHHMLNIQIKFR